MLGLLTGLGLLELQHLIYPRLSTGFGMLVFFTDLNVVSAIFLRICFVGLKESICEARKNVFYFTLKALFVLVIINF